MTSGHTMKCWRPKDQWRHQACSAVEPLWDLGPAATELQNLSNWSMGSLISQPSIATFSWPMLGHETYETFQPSVPVSRLPDRLHRWTTTLQGSHGILHVSSFTTALGTCVLPLPLLLCNLLFQHALQLLILLPANGKRCDSWTGMLWKVMQKLPWRSEHLLRLQWEGKAPGCFHRSYR